MSRLIKTRENRPRIRGGRFHRSTTSNSHRVAGRQAARVFSFNSSLLDVSRAGVGCSCGARNGYAWVDGDHLGEDIQDWLNIISIRTFIPRCCVCK